VDITLLGWIGILLSFAATFVVVRREEGLERIALMLFLAFLQVIVAIYFYDWVQTNTSDASGYYYDPYKFYDRGFGLGTQFVIWTVQTLKQWPGGTYLDFFLLFSASGTWGVAILMRTFEEVFEKAGTRLPGAIFLLLFLPGIHFWTAFLGKDGFLFLGAAITARAAVDIQRRWLGFAVGVLVMIAFRPHIALIGVASVSIAILLEPRTNLVVKFLLSLVAFGGLLAGAMTVESTFRVDVTNAESVSDFLAAQSRVAEVSTGGSTVEVSSFPLKLLSLLFRPFFFDAGGLPGLIASFENLLLVFLFGYLIYNGRWVAVLFRRVFVVRYCAIFAFTLTMLLAMIFYNVGLGLRQKMMIMPALLTIFAAVIATTRVRAPVRRLRPRVA